VPGTALARRWRLAALVCVTAGAVVARPTAATAPDYPVALQAVARDIAALKSQFPQLRAFSADTHFRAEDLVVDYAYRTYRPQPQVGRPFGGWSVQVPNPYADGVWFYINFHDPDLALQIDTQPAMVPMLCFDRMRFTFLILEGKETKPLDGPIRAILTPHGARRCGER
jgi:hypothetical protein